MNLELHTFDDLVEELCRRVEKRPDMAMVIAVTRRAETEEHAPGEGTASLSMRRWAGNTHAAYGLSFRLHKYIEEALLDTDGDEEEDKYNG